MALTRRLLKEWQLEDEMIEKIIAAHAATVHALKEERDEARAQADMLQAAQEEVQRLKAEVEELTGCRQQAQEAQAALESYMAQQEKEKTDRRNGEAIRCLLEEAGCNPHAVELLMPQVKAEDILWEDEKVMNGTALLAEVMSKYGAFFAKEETLPTRLFAPPARPGRAVSARDIASMTQEEINNHWNMIKDVLTKGVN